MRVLILTSCLALTAACVATETGPPTATALGDTDGHYAGLRYSPDGTRIAFWRPATDSVGGWRLWTANADFSGAHEHAVRNAGQPLPAMWSPDGSRLAVQSSDFGAADIVLVPSAGGTPTRLTSGAGLEFPAAWFADGDRLVFTASGGGDGGQYTTLTISASTGTQRPLIPAETRTHIAWPSPDGSHLAVFVYDPPRTLVYLTDSAGANPRPLLDEGFELVNFESPWSPDGRHVVFESRRTGTSDLWIASVEGGEPRQLTRDVRNDAFPRWSPDGAWIAFLSERGRQTDVWVVPSDGGEEVRVTDTPTEEFEAQWRPGAGIATVTFLERTEQAAVWATSLVDGSERQVTPDSVRVSWFNVAHGGDRISAVIPRGGGVQDLVVMPLAGGEMRTVVSGGTVDAPWWAPNDSLLMFGSDRAGTWDVWVVDPNGGAARNLVGWPGSWEFAPQWTADGTILFQSDRTKPWGDAWEVDPSGGEPRQLTKTGSVLQAFSHTRSTARLANEFGARAGEVIVSLINPDGTLRRVWDRSNVVTSPTASPDGAWASALVEQPDGQVRGTLLSLRGQPPRVLLNPGEVISNWSADGTRFLFRVPSGGAMDLAVFTLADGSRRRLTTTPEDEAGPEFTPDGNTVVYRRTKRVQRVHSADLSAALRR